MYVSLFFVQRLQLWLVSSEVSRQKPQRWKQTETKAIRQHIRTYIAQNLHTTKPKRQSLHSFHVHYNKTYHIQYSGYHALYYWEIRTTSVGEACAQTDACCAKIEGIDYCVLFKRLNELGLTWDASSGTMHGATTDVCGRKTRYDHMHVFYKHVSYSNNEFCGNNYN